MFMPMRRQPMDESWKDDAACVGVDGDIFFPGRGESHEPALYYCRQCPVRAECLEYGLDEDAGVWGGASDRERRRIRRRRAMGWTVHPTRSDRSP